MNPPAAADKVAILDRDGTIVIDRGYLDDPAGLEFASGAAEGLRCLHDAGYRLVVISNQSGVGRGYFPLERVSAMNARLERMVEDIGARLAGIYCCPHAPEDGCDCRKPALGLLHRAAAELRFDPAAAVMIGDRASDIEFGRRAGARTVLITTGAAAGATAGPGASPVDARADLIAPTLIAAARALTSMPP